MPKLTQRQAATLVELVKFATTNGGRIPTGPEFAEIIGDITPRGALARISRLIKKNHLPLREGEKNYLNYNQLITEKESACFCIKVYEISTSSNYGRITKRDIATLLNLPSKDCDEFVRLCCDAGYITLISSSISAVRAGEKIFKQLEYLKLLADI